jgi:YVTN family beta-propeller protein
VTPDGSSVYVANQNSGTVSVIDTATNAVIATVRVGVEPNGVAVSPDGGRVYIANGASGTVSVIATATNTVIATIPVGVGAEEGIRCLTNPRCGSRHVRDREQEDAT